MRLAHPKVVETFHSKATKCDPKTLDKVKGRGNTKAIKIHRLLTMNFTSVHLINAEICQRIRANVGILVVQERRLQTSATCVQ